MKVLAAIAVVIGALGLWGYSRWDYETLRYRLTYEVAVGDEIRTGSAVIQMYWEDTTRLPLPNTGAGHQIAGEAVVVDLGEGRYLFSLMKGAESEADPNELVQHAFGLSQGKYSDLQLLPSVRLLKQTPNARVVLEPDLLPLLVTFTDINDPMTVTRVDPNNLAATFGGGVSLKSVTMEITEEPVTKGRVEAVLAWIRSLEGGYLHGGFTSKGSPMGLIGLDFKNGEQ